MSEFFSVFFFFFYQRSLSVVCFEKVVLLALVDFTGNRRPIRNRFWVPLMYVVRQSKGTLFFSLSLFLSL